RRTACASSSARACVGMATTSMWTAILEPMIVREKSFRMLDGLFGALMIGAVAVIVGGQAGIATGLFVSIGAAFVGTLFSILNVFVAGRHRPLLIARYEMLGATAVCAIGLPALMLVGVGVPETPGASLLEYCGLVPRGLDWGWLFLLSSVCTVFAYTQYVDLVRRLSVFVINFATNLEPVYGLLLGAILLGEYRGLNGWFYLGAALIAGLVAAYPLVTGVARWKRLRQGDPSAT
ncbi:MAG: EamA family transporter, partial [Planctomycetota bacterium]